jgi:hypothetical protein
MSPEVLIYIQNVKSFFKTNEDTKKYFLTDVDEELFFKHLGEISQKNFDKNGEVMLTQEQFELLRKTLVVIKISEKEYKEDDKKDNVYFKMKGFDDICLN